MEEVLKQIQDIYYKLQRLELLFSPTMRNPGHVHQYPMGEVYYFDTTGTTITISDVSDGSTNMVVANPTTTLSTLSMEFDSPSAGRLRYIGTNRRFFHIASSVSFAPSVANETFVAGVAKNGTVVGSCRILIKVAGASDTASSALHCFTHLDPGDYIELYVGNTTDADDFVIKTMDLFAMGMDD